MLLLFRVGGVMHAMQQQKQAARLPRGMYMASTNLSRSCHPLVSASCLCCADNPPRSPASLGVLRPCLKKTTNRMHPNPALSVLYVLTECIHTEGYLTAYKVDPSTGGMRELGRVTLTGRSSCYISFDKYAHHAIVTNYWDGLINVVELSPAGVPLRVVQEHQQTRRPAWRQVESREVSRVWTVCELGFAVTRAAGNSQRVSQQGPCC